MLTLLSRLFKLKMAQFFFKKTNKPNPAIGELFCQKSLGPKYKKFVITLKKTLYEGCQLRIRISQRITVYGKRFGMWNNGPGKEHLKKNCKKSCVRLPPYTSHRSLSRAIIYSYIHYSIVFAINEVITPKNSHLFVWRYNLDSTYVVETMCTWNSDDVNSKKIISRRMSVY
jgi:hypothetical protein